jgi:2,5-diamino-6-(ribosylamino)-4(3H)-pyrimidinone 5'-phosphate reductase
MLPEVIIHNSVTLDNAFTAEAFSKKSVDIGLHYEVLLSFHPDALLTGSGSALLGTEMCGDNFPPEDESDFKKPVISPEDKRPYDILVDSRGVLKGKLHFYRRLLHIKDVIVLVSKKTPKDYIDYLSERDYDYIISGDENVDLNTALFELKSKYGFLVIVSDSGSLLNGVIMNEKIAKKLSLLVYPEIAGKNFRKLFENVTIPVNADLLTSGTLKDGIVHLLYHLK